MKNVNVKAQSPIWLQEKLRRCGIRSIDPIVDITNYVLLELGQPMHAFDASKVAQPVQVRLANNGEELVLLDEMCIRDRPSAGDSTIVPVTITEQPVVKRKTSLS